MIEFDQVVFRKLENGDYLRVMAERYGTNAFVMLGELAPDDRETVVWRWTLELTMAGLAEMNREIAHALVVLATSGTAKLVQRQDQVQQLVLQLDCERGAHPSSDEIEVVTEGAINGKDDASESRRVL